MDGNPVSVLAQNLAMCEILLSGAISHRNCRQYPQRDTQRYCYADHKQGPHDCVTKSAADLESGGRKSGKRVPAKSAAASVNQHDEHRERGTHAKNATSQVPTVNAALKSDLRSSMDRSSFGGVGTDDSTIAVCVRPIMLHSDADSSA